MHLSNNNKSVLLLQVLNHKTLTTTKKSKICPLVTTIAQHTSFIAMRYNSFKRILNGCLRYNIEVILI